MKFTHHRFRVLVGVLCGIVGVALWFSLHGLLFERLMDGIAWLLIAAALCFVPEFHFTASGNWFMLVFGLLLSVAGLWFTVFAVRTFLGSRPHGLLPFYEFIGIGPLMLVAGVIIAFEKKNAA